MRTALLFLFICFQAIHSFAQVDLYYSLYRKKSFPELQKLLNERKATRDPAELIFEASVFAAYGDHDMALSCLRSARKAGGLNDTLRFVSLSTELDIASRKKEYRKAAGVSSELLSNFRSWIPADLYEEELQAQKIHQIAQDVPAQSIRRLGDTRITMEKDLAGLMNIPVNMGDTTMNFVFDSGAGMSVISEKYARKLNVKMLSDSTVQVKSGSTGTATTSKVGVADQIRIGQMELKQVLFLVFPDSALSFAGGKYEIRGIIGFPVMAAMQEVTLAGPELFVPKTPGRRTGGAPMILYDHMPVVYLGYKGAELPFTFDTGANTSTLSDNFYHRFREGIDGLSAPRTEELHGVGGSSKKFNGVEVKKIELVSGNSVIQLNNIFIMKEPFDANSDLFYGNIGKDVVRSFKSVTISFANGAVFFNN